MAGGRPARDPDGTLNSGVDKHQEVEGMGDYELKMYHWLFSHLPFLGLALSYLLSRRAHSLRRHTSDDAEV